jgi:ribosomal protein S18 acetylase RimI-like enzyme
LTVFETLNLDPDFLSKRGHVSFLQEAPKKISIALVKMITRTMTSLQAGPSSSSSAYYCSSSSPSPSSSSSIAWHRRHNAKNVSYEDMRSRRTRNPSKKTQIFRARAVQSDHDRTKELAHESKGSSSTVSSATASAGSNSIARAGNQTSVWTQTNQGVKSELSPAHQQKKSAFTMRDTTNRAIRTFAGNARTLLSGGTINISNSNSINNNNSTRLKATSAPSATAIGEDVRGGNNGALVVGNSLKESLIAKITNGVIMPQQQRQQQREEQQVSELIKASPTTNNDTTVVVIDERSTQTQAQTSNNNNNNNNSFEQIGRDNVRIAMGDQDFEVVANLRATAFYDDLTERQALPFPPRFTPTFHREFAQRERKALAERVVRPTSACAKCVCLVVDDSGDHLVVERLRNSSSAVIGCLDVSIRHNPSINNASSPKTETFVYVDNVAVARRARRRGAAKALLEAASNEAIAWGAREMFTHVHCENSAARRLYHAYGFRALVPEEENADETQQGKTNATNNNRYGRLAGLVMIRAPLPLKRIDPISSSSSLSSDCDCGFEDIEIIDECICGKSKSTGCKDSKRNLISL